MGGVWAKSKGKEGNMPSSRQNIALESLGWGILRLSKERVRRHTRRSVNTGNTPVFQLVTLISERVCREPG